MTNLPNQNKKNTTLSIEDEKKLLFNKTIHCPVCESIFKTKTVKVNAPRIESKDSDFFIRYKTINPYFYDVTVCQKCGYSALKIDFDHIREKQREFVLKSITPKWSETTYPDIFDVDIAIDRYKLALINALTIKKKPSTIGMICLKIAWMYRLKRNDTSELLFIEKAFNSFDSAFFNEQLPVYGMQKSTLLYLLAILEYKLKRPDDALRKLSEVLIDDTAPHRLKELTRDLKDLIKIDKKRAE
ncbi:DUF2225 domain-containing protein [uncultured Clostridium sp.]|uniref:DUF2225 domain-containing protein n=1 Tax=uncultured Clostridium sp. TaxID=59620 RepID=UPI002621BBF9|nr:DUF2225 domain-containing protein [uncultured Clostridium sp.]